MSEARLLVPNAILFILDPKDEAVIVPGYDDSAPTSHNDSCVSVKAQAEVDGEVVVHLVSPLRDEQPVGFDVVFEGVLDCPSRTVAVVTSELDRVLEAEATSARPRLRIAVQDSDSPEIIWVEVEG